jgi:hypothetical protein
MPKTIKQLSPRQQTVVKFKIAEILMQADLAQQPEDATRAKCHWSTPSPGPSRSEGCSQYRTESNIPLQKIDLESTTTAASWLQECGRTL